MSAQLDELEAIAVATVPCPRCEVGAGLPCVALSETGGPVQRADHSHEPRLLAVRAAYALGYTTDDRVAGLMSAELIDSIVQTGREA